MDARTGAFASKLHLHFDTSPEVDPHDESNHHKSFSLRLFPYFLLCTLTFSRVDTVGWYDELSHKSGSTNFSNILLRRAANQSSQSYSGRQSHTAVSSIPFIGRRKDSFDHSLSSTSQTHTEPEMCSKVRTPLRGGISHTRVCLYLPLLNFAESDLEPLLALQFHNSVVFIFLPASKNPCSALSFFVICHWTPLSMYSGFCSNSAPWALSRCKLNSYLYTVPGMNIIADRMCYWRLKLARCKTVVMRNTS